MPKNKGKGGKNRRRGKNENEEKREVSALRQWITMPHANSPILQLIFKEEGQGS